MRLGQLDSTRSRRGRSWNNQTRPNKSTNSPCPRWIWWGSSGRRQWLGLKLVGDIFHSFPLKSTGELSFSHPCPIFRPKNHTSLAAALTLRLGRATSSINLFGAIRDEQDPKSCWVQPVQLWGTHLKAAWQELCWKMMICFVNKVGIIFCKEKRTSTLPNARQRCQWTVCRLNRDELIV